MKQLLVAAIWKLKKMTLQKPRVFCCKFKINSRNSQKKEKENRGLALILVLRTPGHLYGTLSMTLLNLCGARLERLQYQLKLPMSSQEIS